MIPELRKKYNAEFSYEKYENFLNDLNTSKMYPVALPISETPLFLSEDLIEKLKAASKEIISQLQTDEFKKYSESAVPQDFYVPNEDEHSLFLLLDFAVCRNERGLIPMLVELQGFPSHFFIMSFLEEKYRKHFSVPDSLTTYYSGLNKDSYIDFIKKILLNGSDPEEVILLEVQPEKQTSRIEFACTKDLTGIDHIDLSAVIKKKNKLYYKKNGREIEIKKIYSRVIQDEYVKKNIQFNFKFTDDLDVEWIGHPNWFYKISKHTLPFLKGNNVPPSVFLKNYDEIPDDLENYVLKSVFSYGGKDVEISVDKEMIEMNKDKSNYILQKKIEYAPLIETPHGYAKTEIRMMYIWPYERTEGFNVYGKNQPILVNNLVRMSKGKMMGVEFNRDQSWVGMTIALHNRSES